MAFEWDIGDSLLCADMPPFLTMNDICFPGGFCLSHVLTSIQSVPSMSEVPLQFMSQLGPAMSFMAPVFNIIDAALAIFKCVEAIPKAIGTLNPGKIIECVPNLVEKINQLLNMIPQLSLPRLVKEIIRAMADLLRGLAYDLRYIQTRIINMAKAIDRAADLNDVNLSDYIVCAQKNNDDALLTTAEALKGIGRIILLINIFIGLFGGPEIPCFGELLDDAELLEPVIETLFALAELLDKIAASIPDPQWAITKALGEQRC